METTKSLSISILQMSSVIGDTNANITKVNQIVENELDCNADVLILPEVWPVGWSCDIFQQCALDFDSNCVFDYLSNLAKKYKINIIGGSLIVKKDANYFNLCPVFNRKGELVATYSKNHLYSYYGCDEGKYITAGESPVLVELDGVKFGLTICYDIRFPEIYRAYAKMGVDVLVNCAAWGASKPIPWEVMTKSRAVENQCFMIALTQSGKINEFESNLGESRIIDYKGEELSSIMFGEGIVCAKINLEDMYDFRKKCTILNDIKSEYEVNVSCEKF